ncbi:MAG: tRNA (adenosine(37)-N6)-threonylcarbamoyltransferase complex dimerization subunit type 1 TsaB [Chloroflexota bacterium]|nr:tRNA (adenosine(37)-N6)-threonylcarbamoyltransferase complex dimerization subunit type 1 TsaB [Chloroflexota bacterium]
MLDQGKPPARSGRSWLLALDTATDQAGLALFDGEQVAEMSWPGGRRQTTSVLPALEGMLAQLDVAVDDIGAVAVAAGPGSFTGLRVGLSLAKGLAITGDRALVGVNTLDIAAAPYTEAGVPCVALVPAGRGRIVWSHYGNHGAPTAPINSTFEEFLVVLRNHAAAIVVGELTTDQQARVAEVHGRVTSMMAHRRLGVLARIGFDQWRSGQVDDPATLEPLYLHGRPNPR